MTDTQDALKITQALLLALQAYEEIGLSTARLMMLRNKAQAEGRDHLSAEEVNGLLAESQAAIDDLDKTLGEAP